LNREEALMMLQAAINESGLPRALIARDSGLSEDAIFAWLKGARAPREESVRQVVAGLRRRSERLAEIATELERAAGEGEEE
jgi:hypothetical protein